MYIHLILAFWLSLMSHEGQNEDLNNNINQVVDENLPELIAIYKHLHKNPEISLQEEKTSAFLAAELRKLGLEVHERVGGYGVVGIFRNGDGPQILYRTDMDALPMYEKTGLPFASDKKAVFDGIETGAMHSCGHDMHMTTWLGTARTMLALKEKWSGTLVIIGQPAEEIGYGAELMLGAGLYERFGVPDMGVALHVSPFLHIGKIAASEGYSMANAESVDITVYGVGSHGAVPHKSVDPIVLASMIVLEIQTIVSRNIDPLEHAVITVGALNSGTKHNIIPDVAELKLTIRTYKNEVRELIHKRLHEITRGIAISAGLTEDKYPQIIQDPGYTPANYNNPDLTRSIKASAANILGEGNVHEAAPMMVGEDFSRYGQTEHKVPTVMYWLGSVRPEVVITDELPGLHSPYYYPDTEGTLSTGIKTTTRILIDHFNDTNIAVRR